MHETSLNRVNQLVGNYEWPHAEMNLASLLRLKNICCALHFLDIFFDVLKRSACFDWITI